MALPRDRRDTSAETAKNRGPDVPRQTRRTVSAIRRVARSGCLRLWYRGSHGSASDGGWPGQRMSRKYARPGGCLAASPFTWPLILWISLARLPPNPKFRPREFPIFAGVHLKSKHATQPARWWAGHPDFCAFCFWLLF